MTSVVAAIVEDASFDPTRVELTDMAGLVPNRGGVRARPVDAETGRPMRANLSATPYPWDASWSWVDFGAGLLGIGPLQPGTYSIDVGSSGYATQTRSATVTAAQWTDLGDVQLTRTGSAHEIDDPWIEQDLVPGTTMDVDLRGIEFRDGVTVTSGLAGVVVNSFTFVDWDRIVVNLTVSLTVTPGYQWTILQVANVGDRFSAGVPGAIADTCVAAGDVVPPEEVRYFRVDKTPRGTRPYLFSWQAVTLDVNGDPETMGLYEISASVNPRSVIGVYFSTAATQQPFTPPFDDASLMFYVVRARDAAGNLGQ